MNLNNIVESIGNIAPLSNAIVDIQKLFENIEELDVKRLVELIESDAVLSLNILKMANAPIYGFSSKIASISQAVSLFGIMQVNGFIMNYAISENIKASTEIFGHSNIRFNDICTMQSALLIEWYGKIDRETTNFLSPLALLMETGKLIISNEVHESAYVDEFTEGFKNAQNVQKYEAELFGIDSYQVSAMVLEHWYLEPHYIKVLQALESEESSSEAIKNYAKILHIIVLAINLKSMLTKESVLEACRHVVKLGLSPDDFAKAALKVKKAYMEKLKERSEHE